MKRLEGEVLNQLDAFGHTQALLETHGLTVDPHQFMGLEINPRAAAITELVLLIGYLQWHFRTRGSGLPPQPVLRDFHNIEYRDAVLAYDRMEYVTDKRGVPVTRWDGKTTKEHPVTGEDVPDENARLPLEHYVNPRPADWPEADFLVGNPPFIGAGWMRSALGDGYTEALRGAWPEVPESADFVMYWWNHAAALTRAGNLKRFGLITTNSLRQTFNRRVLERHLSPPVVPAKTRSPDAAQRNPGPIAPDSGASAPASGLPPLSLAFAIPDHPWVDSADGAAVRIAMTVGTAGAAPGRLLSVEEEREGGEDAVDVRLTSKHGRINADLTVGANLSAARPLLANGLISSPGVKLHGAGFIVTPPEAAALGLGTVPGLERRIRPYRNGKDLNACPRVVMVIDLVGLTEEEVRVKLPTIYQRVYNRVKPERDQSSDSELRTKWWLFRRTNEVMRNAIAELSRYIGTAETSKHRFFQFLDAKILPDNMLIAIGLDDAWYLGVLSSRVHVCWALAAGGRLGVGNDPRYNKTRCFEPFPFPAATPEQQARIRVLAEELDAHRKRQQAAHPSLTLTGLYNVLEKLKSGEALTAKEKVIHEQGLVSVLKTLHDGLDRAVLEAYGWSDLAPLLEVVNGNAAPGGGLPATRDDCREALDTALLERLVALNAERATEEARSLVRWLRPEFQHPEARPVQGELPAEGEAAEEGGAIAGKPAPTAAERLPWPDKLPEQVAAVARVLSDARAPLTEAQIAERFAGRGPWKKRLPQLLETLVALGRVRTAGDRYVGV